MFAFLTRENKLTFEVIYPDESLEMFDLVVLAGKETKKDMKLVKKLKAPAVSMARCPAFYLSSKAGFILRSPYTMKIFMDGEKFAVNCRTAFDFDAVTMHGDSQSEPYFKGKTVIKINNPVLIKEKSGIDCVYMPAWQFNKKISTEFDGISGFIDFKYNNAANIFVVVDNDYLAKHREVTINAGDPLAHVVPITDKKIELVSKVDNNFTPINNYKFAIDEPHHAVTKRLLDRNLCDN